MSEVRHRHNGVLRAAKKLKKTEIDFTKCQQLVREIEILSELDHPYISKLHEVYDEQDHITLIMDRCQGIDLLKHMSRNVMSSREVASVTKQLLQALSYVHRKGFAHRDIKPNNILYDPEAKVIKLIDFGIATQVSPDTMCSDMVGTLVFLAPEVLRRRYNEKCDVWSVGIMLFMMIFRRSPWKGQKDDILTEINCGDIDYQGTEWS